MEQKPLAYGLLPKTVAAIMMLCKNMRVKVRSPDEDTGYLDIVAGVLQGDILAPYLFIISLDYMLRTSIDLMKEKKERSRRYPAQIFTDADYTDDKVLLVNTPALAESRQHSLERGAAGIGLEVNVDKTENICLNRRGNISTLNGNSLKLVDKFTYLGSSASSTEKDINTRLAKVWTTID